MSSCDQPVRRALSLAELQQLWASIRDAEDAAQLLRDTLTSLYRMLQAGAGDRREPVAPGAYAIPTCQHQAITQAILDRAAAWGAAPAVSLELVNLMPATYHDPTAPAPQPPRVDHRPERHTLSIARQAVDVIAACHQRITALADYFGWHSPHTSRAWQSWQLHLAGLLCMHLGADTRITRDGPLSLLVATESGTVYGIIFHPTPQRCTIDGCPATITDTTTTAGGRDPAAAHPGPHQPCYPLDAPQPGTWQAHS